MAHPSKSDVESLLWTKQGLPGGSDGKVPVCNAGDLGSIPGLGRSPGEGSRKESGTTERLHVHIHGLSK